MTRRTTPLRKIKIMISSQCDRMFPAGGRTLTELRRVIRDNVQSSKLLGHDVFEVWINEDSPGRETNLNSWEACLAEVRKADILIVLATGHAGWAPSDGDIGICHAELMTAHNASPAKIRLIKGERNLYATGGAALVWWRSLAQRGQLSRAIWTAPSPHLRFWRSHR